ncbi:MAG: hypothetical protein COA74_11925 [Gammaproteobacteria bacterium]|nr:MAG: hypothetical protein COA74_11925 [Gammaproteobacteria bacterium]
MLANNNHIENIRILSRFRIVAIIGQSSLILFSVWFFNLSLEFGWIVLILAIEVIFQLYVIVNIKRHITFTVDHVFGHIIIDCLILSGLIYFSGGTNNPFVYLLLLFMALASFMLSKKYLVITAAILLTLYSLLNLIQRPLEYSDPSPLNSFHFHLIGMWINFILSIILIAIFGLLTRRAILNQEKKIQQLREKQLQDEQILGLGIMSASAAHELGTPLSTMAIIVDDLQYDDLNSPYKADFTVLSEQVKKCKHIIATLQQRSRFSQQQISLQNDPLTAENLKQQLNTFFESWLVYRPKIKLNTRWDRTIDQIDFQFSISLEQAIINLLDNAADASLENQSDQVNVAISITGKKLIIDIADYGKGITNEAKKSLGQKIQHSNKRNGLGWGLLLSNVSIERVGGSVQLLERETVGSLTRIFIPLGNEK